MATTSITSPFPWSCCSSTTTVDNRRLYIKSRYSTRINPNFLPLTAVRSSKAGVEDELDSRSDEPNLLPFGSQEDLKYLGKLGAGSIVGAVAIKYGSILLPEITRPNILLALFMIFAPCFIAVLLLIRQSQIEEDEDRNITRKKGIE